MRSNGLVTAFGVGDERSIRKLLSRVERNVVQRTVFTPTDDGGP